MTIWTFLKRAALVAGTITALFAAAKVLGDIDLAPVRAEAQARAKSDSDQAEKLSQIDRKVDIILEAVVSPKRRKGVVQ